MSFMIEVVVYLTVITDKPKRDVFYYTRLEKQIVDAGLMPDN